MSNVISAEFNHFRMYLAKRGFDDKDIEAMGCFEALSSRQVQEFSGNNPLSHGWPAGALIRYLDRQGQDTGFYLVRFLGERKGYRLKENEKVVKAVALKGSRPRAHFPRRNPAPTKGMVVHICESALKAEVVAKAGFYAIGLNGVWTYSDRNESQLLIPDLRDLPWHLIKEVRILFDSNVTSNDDVAAAAQRLSIRLRDVVHFNNTLLKVLPPNPEGDWGIDDAAATLGAEWLKDFLAGTADRMDLDEFALRLRDLNEQCCIVEEIGQIAKYTEHPVILMSRSSFVDVNYANWTLPGEDDKKISIPRNWLIWENVNKVPRLIMKPGMDKMVPGQFLNLWVDPKIEATEPSAVWAEFTRNMVSDTPAWKWMEQWIAHLVQHPGEKMTTYAMLVGPAGVGKTLLTTAIERILGPENCALIGQEDLEGGFNGLHAVKLFTAINEFYAKDQGVGNKLKRIVTENTTHVKPKYGREFSVPSVCNYMITTNELGALKLDDDDRRAGVVECSPIESHYGDVEYFTRIAAEIRDNPGGILAHYQAISLEDFSRWSPALTTQAKRDMTEQRRNQYEQLAWQISNDRDEFLTAVDVDTGIRYISLELLTARAQNKNLIEAGQYDKTVGNKLNAALRKAGVRPWKGNSTGQLSYKNKRHRIYCLPGGSISAGDEFVRGDLDRWCARLKY